MPNSQKAAPGGRSTFTVQNNRDFAVTAIGVFSGEAARDMGIKRFDTAAAKRLLATKGMNVLRTPVVIKPGQKATLDVQFPGCREDWAAFIALVKVGAPDIPVLRYVPTEFYDDPSAPIASNHVKGSVVLNPRKRGAHVAQPPKAAQPPTTTVAEGAIRRVVSEMLRKR